MPSGEGEPGEGPAPALGAHLRDRATEIADHLVGMLRRGDIGPASLEPGEAAILEASVRESARAGTLAVADYLIAGETLSRARAEQWDWSGEAALNGMFTLSGLTKLYLEWRRTCVDAVRDAARACGATDEEQDIAVAAVRVGSDTSMVRMARRFEVTRHELEAQLEESQARLEHQALHDPLTGLANRVLLLDRLEHALKAAHPSGVAALFLDLDSFKAVNDVSGHSVGDELLVEVGARLQAVVRPTDTVARLGGDEFVVVCEDMTSPVTEALAVANRLMAALRRPIQVSGREVMVAASIGVAPAEPHERGEALLARADQAMYRAKQLGRGRVELYDWAIDRQATRHAVISTALRRALRAGELAVAYQPVRALPDQSLVSREALLRWSSSELGHVGPAEFVPLAERGGMIEEIGTWVLRRACEDCARWRAGGEPEVGVAVNVSGLQLESAHFADGVHEALASSGLAPRALTLEIGEPLLTVDPAAALAGLERLRPLGVRLAVDHFGTGYCSLSWLARLPLDALKIDRSFVVALGADEREPRIVEAMVRIGHTLGLAVVAQGVETDEQLARLVALGCDGAQGYLLGRPAPWGGAPSGVGPQLSRSSATG